jgi:hypothetical protein
VTASKAKEEIADAFGDAVVFGIQVMTALNLNAEDVLHKVFDEVLTRDYTKVKKL